MNATQPTATEMTAKDISPEALAVLLKALIAVGSELEDVTIRRQFRPGTLDAIRAALALIPVAP